MTYPRTVSAQLLDYDGSVVTGTPLALAFNVSFYDEEDGPGRGQVSISLSVVGSAELLPGRYVNCLVEGIPRFTFKIEGNPQYNEIERGEEHDQIVTVQGRGWGCSFDEAPTFPEYSLKYQFDTTSRLFSFASVLFPNAGAWVAAVEQHEYLEGVATAACYGHQQTAPDGLAYPAPIGFPWSTDPANLVFGTPTANWEPVYWIRTGDQPDYVSPGYWCFRRTLVLADFTQVVFATTGDNYFTLFLQGVPILGETITNADHWMWLGFKTHKMWLAAGTYTVAAVVYNIPFDELGATSPPVQPACPAEGFAGGARYENSGGLLTVLFEDDDDPTTPPVHILSSDDSWNSHYDATSWPGWTPGQIIQQLIDEAIAHSCITIYNSNTFDATDDSNSDPWLPFDSTVTRGDIATFELTVGDSLMQALDQMVKEGYIHWHVRPGTLILDVYRGRVPITPASSATLAWAVNLASLERNATEPYANAFLVQWEGGYMEVVDGAAEIAYNTRSYSTIASRAPSEEEAQQEAIAELDRAAQAQYPAVITVVEPTGAGDCPYEAFETGDYVTAPAEGGSTELIRVKTISCRQDAEGHAVWTVGLNMKLDVPTRHRDELLRQIGGRNQIVRNKVDQP